MDAVKSMEKYYLSVRPQTNEIYSIHREGCPFMPDDTRRIFLGRFASGEEARDEGKKYEIKSCTCRYCITETTEQANQANSLSEYFPSEKQLAQQFSIRLSYLLN